ncbi:MAG: hypothetical protein RL318_230 [Fibrobacterota bacterium]|jgi:ornithine decarboxylase
MANRTDYHGDDAWEGFVNRSRDLPTPHLLVNLDIVRDNHRKLGENFPFARIYYAVKANPATQVIRLIDRLGSCFDIASIHELDRVLEQGVDPGRVSFGNTIKKASDIALAWSKGVRMFATDCLSDLENIARHAPGSKVYVRILVDGSDTADWPLSRKFGCHPDKAVQLHVKAVELGLDPYGISFHVGSQQRDISQWMSAIWKVRDVFDELAAKGIRLRMINMGGGFPARYCGKTPPLSVYAFRIRGYLEHAFGVGSIPEIILEPGRSMVAESGILASEVIMVARKNVDDPHRWAYIDAGKFNGLIETLDESIKYPIVAGSSPEQESEVEPFILAGPTCDSMDVLYEKQPYSLPRGLASGDRLYWLSTGAYTTSYASVEFNGFPPIPAHFFGEEIA